MIGILGRKLGMTRIVQEDGQLIPTTIIKCDPNTIAQIKTSDKDGYSAVVVGLEPRKKPTKTKKFYFLREFKTESPADFKAGDLFNVDIFKAGDVVTLTGTSKGKGFQGVVKRWHMAGGPASHGSHFHREPGSVGARAKPGKIHKGKHLPGRMGGETVTIKKTPIIYVNPELNLIGVKGAVPGAINSFVSIKKYS